MWTAPPANVFGLLRVQVECEGGLYGWGESGIGKGRPLAVEGMVAHFKTFLIGRDAMQIGALWQVCLLDRAPAVPASHCEKRTSCGRPRARAGGGGSALPFQVHQTSHGAEPEIECALSRNVPRLCDAGDVWAAAPRRVSRVPCPTNTATTATATPARTPSSHHHHCHTTTATVPPWVRAG